jgi:outer membrane immunogenic protein
MKLLSGILGLTLTSVVALASANAADIYRAPEAVGGYKDSYVPVATWTGFYVGVNGGYAWSENSNQYSFPKFGGLSSEGGFGGGQIGYNWQGLGLGRGVVLGVEADIQGAGIDDSAKAVDGYKYKSKLDYFGTVRGRIGYGFDKSLIYFTGGFAYGGIDNTAFNGISLFKKEETATGYVIGGGYEHKINPAWSLKAEYKYIDLGKNDPVGVSGAFVGRTLTSFGLKVDDDAYHTVSVGLNYHVGTSYEPLK